MFPYNVQRRCKNNQSNAAALEAEMRAMRQWGEVTARDGTIAKLMEQHEKVTTDSIKSPPL